MHTPCYKQFNFRPTEADTAYNQQWYEMDYEYAQIPDVCSQRFTTANFVSKALFHDLNELLLFYWWERQGLWNFLVWQFVKT